MALDMSSNKWVDVALFDRLIRKFEERSSIPALVSFDTYQTNLADPLPGDANESENSECVLDNPREFEHLLDMLGNILKQVGNCYIAYIFPVCYSPTSSILCMNYFMYSCIYYCNSCISCLNFSSPIYPCVVAQVEGINCFFFVVLVIDS